MLGWAGGGGQRGTENRGTEGVGKVSFAPSAAPVQTQELHCGIQQEGHKFKAGSPSRGLDLRMKQRLQGQIPPPPLNRGGSWCFLGEERSGSGEQATPEQRPEELTYSQYSHRL